MDSRNVPQLSFSPVILEGDEALKLSLVASGPGWKRDYSAMATVAAPKNKERKDKEEEKKEDEEEDKKKKEDGLECLAKAIEGFGAVYEKMEKLKMETIVELEAERMKFEKDLELGRMKMFVDLQVALAKSRSKRSKPGGSADGVRARDGSNDGVAGPSR